jgi:uncharacterized OB-fold protein
MNCPQCGREVSDNATFCPSCGASLVSVSSGKVTLLTSNHAPGYRVEKVIGLVYGISVRSRGLGGNLMAGLRTLKGGEIKEYTQMAH